MLTETPAILAFIAQSFPKAKLAPFDDPFAFAQVQSINSYLCSTVHVAHAHKGRGYRWATEETSFADMKRKVPETMAACFALIERDMLKGPWVMGEQYTICDPYLYTISGWLEGDGVDLAKLPEGRRASQADGGPVRPYRRWCRKRRRWRRRASLARSDSDASNPECHVHALGSTFGSLAGTTVLCRAPLRAPSRGRCRA